MFKTKKKKKKTDKPACSQQIAQYTFEVKMSSVFVLGRVNELRPQPLRSEGIHC